MAIPTDQGSSTELLRILASGLVGALSAIVAQTVANVFASARHRKELALKERQLILHFLSPLSERRLLAFETIYDRIQVAIEESSMTLRDYQQIRPMLLYLPGELRDSFLDAMAELLGATRESSETRKAIAVENLKALQIDLERELGIDLVNRGISDIEPRE